MSEYRVNLDSYNGPLDLLLYLIRRDEVDIYDIPVARVTQQYIQYVDVLKSLDPNLAGEFLVMAATLVEIKSRMLLPTPPPEELQATDVSIDPRAELVRQLLEYKAFKDAAGDLEKAAQTQALRFPRKPALPQVDPTELDIEDVQIWDLMDAFSKLLAAVGQTRRAHEVIYDDTPQELHQTDILDRLSREGTMTFARIFEGRTSRGEIVGLFLGLLELVRQKQVIVTQEAGFAEIFVHIRPDAPTDHTPGIDEGLLPQHQTQAQLEHSTPTPEQGDEIIAHEPSRPQDSADDDAVVDDGLGDLDAELQELDHKLSAMDRPGEYISEVQPDSPNEDDDDDDSPDVAGTGA